MMISISRSSALVPPLLRGETLRDRVKLAIAASRTADGVANNFWFVGNLGLIHVEFFFAALDYCDEVSGGDDDEFKHLLAAWEESMGIVLGELAPEFADYANPSFGSAMLETTQFRDAIRDPGFLQMANAAGLAVTKEEVHLSLLSEGKTATEHSEEIAALRRLWQRH